MCIKVVLSKKLTSGLSNDINSTMSNDGTNACAFLCAIIWDRLLDGNFLYSWQDIAILAEDVISKSAASFNHLRDNEHLYGAREAFSILSKGSVLPYCHEVTEEIISPDGVLSDKGNITMT